MRCLCVSSFVVYGWSTERRSAPCPVRLLLGIRLVGAVSAGAVRVRLSPRATTSRSCCSWGRRGRCGGRGRRVAFRRGGGRRRRVGAAGSRFGRVRVGRVGCGGSGFGRGGFGRRGSGDGRRRAGCVGARGCGLAGGRRPGGAWGRVRGGGGRGPRAGRGG